MAERICELNNNGEGQSRGDLGGIRMRALALSILLQAASLSRGTAEDRVDYRFEDYQEEGGRIHVQTHGVYFDTALGSQIALKGNVILDAISGATPTGAPPLLNQTTVDKAPMDDKRYAGFLEPTFKLGIHTLSPQFAYSEESDYRSIGVALNDAMDFNEKNTTLTLGISHSFDHVLPNEGERYVSGTNFDLLVASPLRKNNTDALIGLTQLLGPATLMSANLTVGYADGFLSDPYKSVLFNQFPYTYPNPYTVWPEKRPDHKFRQVAFFSLSHNFEKLDGAGEISYRFSHDDFGVRAHTASLQWNQKLGKYVTLSPLFRFYTQSQASFYATDFPGDPDNQSINPLPRYYSSDYRLSALNSFTAGLSISVKLGEHASLELSYKRYEMYGTDHRTSADQYPKANVFGGGVTLWF